ncbi:glycoside hydrolase family 15 protein, partial [Streptomyces sp. NPDC048564]|uniref:glycoside hydrolase family 15 protein n=1 Tax=Streptomyces sp. NPDC048564 TaxID=3155760 RepID=UPI00341FDB24
TVCLPPYPRAPRPAPPPPGRRAPPPPRGEGTFLACSFWLAEALHMTGRTQEARELFDRLVGLTNDVGLLAEEYDPVAGHQLGNFPQAFSHIGLVNTALALFGGDGAG